MRWKHSAPTNPLDILKSYALILARKMAFVAVGWAAIYFISQPFRYSPPDAVGGINFLTLFAPVLGGLAGLVAGWYMATDAAEDSGLHGLGLWTILVLASVLPMWFVEGIFHSLLRWPMNFGGFMVLGFANLLALAAAVWHAASQE